MPSEALLSYPPGMSRRVSTVATSVALTYHPPLGTPDDQGKHCFCTGLRQGLAVLTASGVTPFDGLASHRQPARIWRP